MWDFLEFIATLGEGLRLLSMLDPSRKYEGESLYWPFGGIFLLIADIAMIIYGVNSEAEWPIYVSIILTIWLLIHLSIRLADVKGREKYFSLNS